MRLLNADTTLHARTVIVHHPARRARRTVQAVLCHVIVAFAACVAGLAATPAAAETVEQWGLYEITLKGPSDGNPFVDVRLSAVFDNGSTQVEVPGFYDGDGIYRIRFMPETQGRWSYETRANR
ncbi:MAG: DUF5060 domain-containing protein, partial [Vicinamibacterales bacterium]|nr:DUF5060 domain-containing protein [Vicinamibacterales bacterium]